MKRSDIMLPHLAQHILIWVGGISLGLLIGSWGTITLINKVNNDQEFLKAYQKIYPDRVLTVIKQKKERK
ncbi:hypothetical protein CVD28_02840 [Bacillus sp. M6-12]|uniref:hypothetical protein n=1 Tax=Bacillus sp. M6-12 TaxID=2054166 RepID=UPI000C78BED9|nr:hypothetical protein [Bacillus sp. M6-12]PLS19368.1 hypothetical protein CVD28_02840 [Bacillus sp. M6-12]